MPIEARRDVFQAIADPTRRKIVNLIARHPMNLNAIALNFEISRPSVSEHVKILHQCGMVSIEKIGRERYCRIQPNSLREVADWVEPFKQLWNQKLDSFEQYLTTLQSRPAKRKPSKRKASKRRK